MDDDLRFRGKDSENPIVLPDDSDENPRGHVKKGPRLKRTRKRNMQISRVGRTAHLSSARTNGLALSLWCFKKMGVAENSVWFCITIEFVSLIAHVRRNPPDDTEQ
jgi:hypothetical protein